MADNLAPRRKKMRLIAEARYERIPEFIDVRGHLIAQLLPKVRKSVPNWQAQEDKILFVDSEKQPADEFVIAFNRMSVILEDPHSVNEFADIARSKLRLAHEVIGKDIPTIARFGVRFISIFDAPEFHTHAQLTKHIAEATIRIPDAVPLKPTDSLVRLVHDQGVITIGPASQGEEWVNRMFKRPDQNVPKSGIGIDVDSFARDSTIKTAEDFVLLFDAVMSLTVATETAYAHQLGLTK